jgi:branched-subunit amino acid transport protein
LKLWLSILVVTVGSWVMKASGPLALHDRQLPPIFVEITSLLVPVLLASLIIIELGGQGWRGFNWPQLVGVGTAGLCQAVRAPMLLTVACAITVTALFRLQFG